MIETQRARELDSSMMVTMTRGELAKMVADILDERLAAILGHRQADDAEPTDSGLIYGTGNIAAALGVNRNTFYRLWSGGKLGKAVFHIGRKVAADRKELLKYVSENGEGYSPKA